ncbi:hypothetical protein ACKC9G_12440 [Pokkaliibacter sp. CJK22405]|uniref:hypothetical protein n=1 Tax=Pokkaliibacter sp. CJK22405 TaxID=3384615 RepID=UPI0039846296
MQISTQGAEKPQSIESVISSTIDNLFNKAEGQGTQGTQLPTGTGAVDFQAQQQPKVDDFTQKRMDGANMASQLDLSEGAMKVMNRFTQGGQGEANILEKPTEANCQRPASDKRNADQIINDNPVLKNLGDQKDIKKDQLKERCGDWENEPDPQKRADAAYKAAKVLNYIDCTKDRDGDERDCAGDGNIEGITSDGDARHGTEAGMVKDFAEKGFDAICGDGERQLDQTTDSHVRKDGSNKDNFQWFVGEVGKVLSKIPILGTVWGPTLEGFGEGRSLGDSFAKAAEGYGKGMAKAIPAILQGPAGIARLGIREGIETAVTEGYKAATGKSDPPPFS